MATKKGKSNKITLGGSDGVRRGGGSAGLCGSSEEFGGGGGRHNLLPLGAPRLHCNSKTHKSGVTPANQTKERTVHELFPGAFWKFDVNRACFPKEKHQNSQKQAKFMNFSFWPFLWFGLPGRLLNKSVSLHFFEINSKQFKSRKVVSAETRAPQFVPCKRA